MDIKLDEDGDIYLVNGDAQTTSIGAEDLAQRLRIRLNTFQGEWFMDNTLGIDWWNRVMGKNRSKMAVDALIQDAILKEPDALQIVSYTSSISTDRVQLLIPRQGLKMGLYLLLLHSCLRQPIKENISGWTF